MKQTVCKYILRELRFDKKLYRICFDAKKCIIQNFKKKKILFGSFQTYVYFFLLRYAVGYADHMQVYPDQRLISLWSRPNNYTIWTYKKGMKIGNTFYITLVFYYITIMYCYQSNVKMLMFINFSLTRKYINC